MKKNYKISMYYDDYFIHHQSIKAFNLRTSNESIVFETDSESIGYLNDNNVKYIIEKNKFEFIKNIILLRKFVILSCVVMLFVLYMNSYRVNDINFNIDTPINDEIASSIESKYKKLLFFDFVTDDFVDLSKNLRSEYSCYEWISISKDYSTINVEITKTGLNQTYNDNLIGNIVASRDGVISSYIVYSGTVSISYNDYVKAGDILIKGAYEDILTTPKGVVMATTYSEETYQVPKTIYEEKLTGNMSYFYEVCILNNNFDILKETNYSLYQEISSSIFSIPNFLQINKIEHYEKNDIIYINDIDTAREYGLTLVDKNFTDNKVLEEESIVSKYVLTTTEYDDYFEITYLVKKLESIGEFEELS